MMTNSTKQKQKNKKEGGLQQDMTKHLLKIPLEGKRATKLKGLP